LYAQLTLVVIYRYVQSSIDTSLYHKDPEFASPGFILAGDDLPKPPPPPPPPVKQQEKGMELFHIEMREFLPGCLTWEYRRFERRCLLFPNNYNAFLG